MVNSIKISYSDDEVKVFHMHVQNKLKEYLKNNKLGSKYEIKHHPEEIQITQKIRTLYEPPMIHLIIL